MTVQEVRNHKEYAVCFEKIKSYPKGFTFTLEWARIPKPQANALKIVLEDACKQGLIEVTSFDLSIDGIETGRTYKKI